MVDPEGKEFIKHACRDCAKHVTERVEPWSYLKFSYLKEVGWKGFVDGPESGVYCATPLSGFNAAERMLELLREEHITDPNVRPIVSEVPDEGVGCVEAPRGTLTHHY